MPRKVTKKNPVIWLSEQVTNEHNVSDSFYFYEKFQYNQIVAGIGDFVLISNADAAEQDREEGCDAAKILSLYEDRSNRHDPFRAKVQWYSKPEDLPKSCKNSIEHIEFLTKEVIEDHRPFDTDVSIETFFKKCSITLTYTKDTELKITRPYQYICRYRLLAVSKRKVQLEPVMEEERRALELLKTPLKSTGAIPKTPTSLVKRMSSVSISETKNWSVSKNDGTKLLLKRAIFTDKNEKNSPRKTMTPKKNSEKARTSLNDNNLSSSKIEELLTMDLEENSDEELPTLVIRENLQSTRRKTSTSSDTTENVIITSRSGRQIKTSKYLDPPVSPVKNKAQRTPLKITIKTRETPVKDSVQHIEPGMVVIRKSPRKYSNEKDTSSDEELPTLIIREHKPSTPKRKTLLAERTRNNVNLDINKENLSEMSYWEPEPSPIRRTPRRSTRKVYNDSDDDFEPEKPVPRTPKIPRTPTTPKTNRVDRGSVKKRRIITSQLTPTLHPRAHLVENPEAFTKENNSLPGRELQLEDILSFVRTNLLDAVSGCMYISGVPGTGKTATVNTALKILKEEADLPEFQLVEVNGMKIAEPRQAYVQIYKQLTDKTVLWEHACSLLEKRFTTPGPRRMPTVMLVDELDALCTRRQDVLYNIVEWASHSTARLTVLAVANTMDLPERALAARVASRLGLTRLTFPPYTHTQLQCIVASRLAGGDVTPDAVQLIARKVAAVSGDARRALALCARALELAGGAGAGLRHVEQALNEAASSATVRAIRACAPAEQLMLRAVAAEVERTGSDETTLSRALSTAGALVLLEGRPYRSAAHIRAPTPSQALAVCSSLAAMRLLLMEPKPREPRLMLNVSVDDVHYATRQISA